MYISDLALSDYRNYRDQVVCFEPGVTVLLGRNGQGKTNLVESIGYLATFSSHRVSADVALVRAGAPGAVVRAKAVESGRERVIELEIIAGRANRAKLNRAPVRPREILGIVRTVVFAPEDLALVKGEPGERRRFLDELAVMRMPRYADLKSRYDKVVRQRSALLKSGRRGELEVWDSQLAAAGADIIRTREALVADIAPHVSESYAALADGAEAHIRLASSLAAVETREGLTPGELDNEERLLRALELARPRELERGICLVGPHRDELVLSIGELPARGYASHGESWSFALSLRLAAFQMMADDDPPILILDDVFAELDAVRRARLAQMVGAAEQVIVTAAVDSDVPAELAGRALRVEDGRVTEVGDE
ncbi:MAG: DNA replication/repair protein RecF [Ruaniaceae bacterium]|nr:DNA replication/repair protein RecF [Ruaniaceae bacterium]